MRPLVVTDCDEVLLHMARHFRDWLAEEHAVEFLLHGEPFRHSLRRTTGEPLAEEEIWPYLHAFFDSQMANQTPIEGAVAAIVELQREADVVVLTNLQDRFSESRRAQLLAVGIDAPVYTNQGPKGAAIRRIVQDLGRERPAVFIDDLAQHHASAAEMQPTIGRLHFCGEPAIAGQIPCALRDGHAHARIDNWQEALPWLLERLHGEQR